LARYGFRWRAILAAGRPIRRRELLGAPSGKKKLMAGDD